MKSAACLVFALLLGACERNPAKPAAQEYPMQGEVVSLDPTAQIATVKAGKIEGWGMEAMTMEYPVKDKQEFSKLKVGEKIQAKITVQGQDYWIATVIEDTGK